MFDIVFSGSPLVDWDLIVSVRPATLGYKLCRWWLVVMPSLHQTCYVCLLGIYLPINTKKVFIRQIMQKVCHMFFRINPLSVHIGIIFYFKIIMLLLLVFRWFWFFQLDSIRFSQKNRDFDSIALNPQQMDDRWRKKSGKNNWNLRKIRTC